MKYVLFREKIDSEDFGNYVSYGILLRDGEVELKRYSDVGRSYLRVHRLCRLCNKLGVDADQFEYILEDFCVEETYRKKPD